MSMFRAVVLFNHFVRPFPHYEYCIFAMLLIGKNYTYKIYLVGRNFML